MDWQAGKMVECGAHVGMVRAQQLLTDGEYAPRGALPRDKQHAYARSSPPVREQAPALHPQRLRPSQRRSPPCLRDRYQTVGHEYLPVFLNTPNASCRRHKTSSAVRQSEVQHVRLVRYHVCGYKCLKPRTVRFRIVVILAVHHKDNIASCSMAPESRRSESTGRLSGRDSTANFDTDDRK